MPEFTREHMLASALLALVAALYLVAGLSVSGVGISDDRAAAQGLPQAAPNTFKPLAKADALSINASTPVEEGLIPAAAPFKLLARTSADRALAVECLTSAIYYEAALEPEDGQRAVAQVVLNRVRHPAYPNSVCGVVYQGYERSTGCQFTFTCDGSLTRAPVAAIWNRAREIAKAALDGYVYAPVGWATHYHANYVVPYWSSTLVKLGDVGNHIFYRWTGGWGRPGAFSSRYSGFEPDVAGIARSLAPMKLAAAATREAPLPETVGTVDKAAAEAALAAAAANPNIALPQGVGAASTGPRAVIRRYEPASREASGLIATTGRKAEDDVPASLRWAITGDRTGSGDGFGKKTDAEAAPAAGAGAAATK
ncbi:cell wall hydrolase [Allosphingosinicella flava]|uniref:Cell wall hydrolase n=2 Tax=Allosphingosinicella flava TaxID=2771430 RepID=A0A7T2LN65_9SPHN|nr:cell wall hydrolase [Sphingosinicella flava]